MTPIKLTALALLAATVAGCAQNNTVSRNDGSALTFHQDAVTDALPAEQAAVLTAQARKIVKGSTTRGAMIGVAVGCGLGVATGNSGKCLSSAAIAAAGGALAGNSRGRKSVSDRMRLAGSKDLARDIRAADAQLFSLKTSLPAHLAAQDAQLQRDRTALAAGRITRAEFDSRLEMFRRDRAALAQALELTAQQSRLASRNLTSAAKSGQTGLDWHITRTGQIADQATSARSSISLL